MREILGVPIERLRQISIGIGEELLNAQQVPFAILANDDEVSPEEMLAMVVWNAIITAASAASFIAQRGGSSVLDQLDLIAEHAQREAGL